MAAYVLVEIEITDPEAYEAYKKLTPATLADYGGRFVVRGAQAEILEGTWNPERLVVLEFPSVEQAKAWWNSPGYTEAKAIRQRAAHTNMIVLEGYQP